MVQDGFLRDQLDSADLWASHYSLEGSLHLGVAVLNDGIEVVHNHLDHNCSDPLSVGKRQSY